MMNSNLSFYQIKLSAFIALSLIYLTSCDSKGKSREYSINSIITDSLYLPISQDKVIVRGIQFIGSEDKNLIAYYDEDIKEIYRYDIDKKKYLDTFRLEKYNESLSNYTFRNYDTLLVLLGNNSVVEMSKNHEKLYDLDGLIKKYVDIFSFTGYLRSHMQVFNDTIVVELANRRPRDMGKPGPDLIHQKYDYDMTILLADTPVFLNKFNAHNILDENERRNYRKSKIRLSLSPEVFVYSFSHLNKLFIYNSKLGKIDTVTLNTKHYTPNDPMDYSKIQDYNYVRNFTFEQTTMNYHVFDKYQHRILAFMKHKGNYIEKNGEKNDYFDLASSFFVLDSNFTQKAEYVIPEKLFGEKYMFFISPHGYYIPANKTRQHDKNKTLFYKFVVPDSSTL